MLRTVLGAAFEPELCNEVASGKVSFAAAQSLRGGMNELGEGPVRSERPCDLEDVRLVGVKRFGLSVKKGGVLQSYCGEAFFGEAKFSCALFHIGVDRLGLLAEKLRLPERAICKLLFCNSKQGHASLYIGVDRFRLLMEELRLFERGSDKILLRNPEQHRIPLDIGVDRFGL